MLSSRFIATSFLCMFYATGLVTAGPQHLGGENQSCQNGKTVTITQTVAPRQASPPPNSAQPPLVTQRPGKVNLGNGGVKTSSAVKNAQSPPVKNGKNGNGNNNSKYVKSSAGNPNSSTDNSNTSTGSVNTGTSSTALPPANTGTGSSDTSLTLDPSVIQTVNGKAQAGGEKDSLVSQNNFINFCVGQTLTNGKQVQGGSCNPTPMGDIPAIDNMPSAKFNSPKNFDTIAANSPFTISLQVSNLKTGVFTNAANTYYAAPQQLSNGVIQGHSHVTVQQMTSLDSPNPLNTKVFAFFKGLNDVAQNGVLTADVTKGLPAGVYRISSINSAGNHQEALGPVAQRGSFNDAIYVTVTDGGNNNSTASSAAVPPSTSPADPSATGKGGNGGQNNSVSSSELPVSTSAGGQNNSVSSSELPVSTSAGGKGNIVSSSELPVSTGKGGKNGGKNSGKNGGKGGDVLSTSTALPESTTPASGNGTPDTKNQNTKSPAVSSSVSPPDSTPTQGANGKGGKRPQGGNNQNPKRMDKRSRSA